MDDLTGKSYSTTAYLRVASLAIAFYSFAETAPSVWRFYRDQWLSHRLTVSFILLILIQFTSILVLTVSNFGFFYSHFTEESCRQFHLLPPSFKVLQAMISQMILGIRAWNLSTRSRRIGWILLVAYVATSAVQWITTLQNRTPKRDNTFGNCRGINGGSLTAWIYYMVAIIYDLGTTAISVTYLLKHQFSSPSTMLARLTKMMLYDGIGYFVFLTIINCANLIIYHADPDIQTACASLGYTATYIFSQRLLLSLYEVSSERRAQTIDGTYTISQTISSARAVNQAMRSQFEPKGSFADSLQLTNPDFQLDTLEAAHADDVNVQVRVERTVTVERRHRKTYELENYSHSGTSSMAHKNIGHTISIVSVASRR
ncbi:hypothetical protein Moror_16313 [Moniliophthora roreri MCA 2997]|uniref:Uncharacterized protein n=1 Tax=Moniliophthora roreri (strain MCA 2997) TaxID=1381753 RepID=V2WVW1_MONRO|nr:hypothetical protein Moror_16313 [Moniliophthora roreri MCA 2997]